MNVREKALCFDKQFGILLFLLQECLIFFFIDDLDLWWQFVRGQSFLFNAGRRL